MSATAFTRYIEQHHVSNMEQFAIVSNTHSLTRLIPKPWCPSLIFSFSDHPSNDLEQYLAYFVLFNLIPGSSPAVVSFPARTVPSNQIAGFFYSAL